MPPSDIRTGVWSGNRFTSYDALEERIRRVAGALIAFGIKQGDFVALLLRNDITFLEITKGVMRIGAIPVPINWHWRAEEIRYVLNDCNPSALFVHSDLLPDLVSALSDVPRTVSVDTPDDLLHLYGRTSPTHEPPLVSYGELLSESTPYLGPKRASPGSMIYTSGTTGQPKGVKRDTPDADQIKANSESRLLISDLRKGVCAMVPGPLYHSAPNAYALAATDAGASLVIMQRFDPELFLHNVAKYKISHALMVPTMFVRLLRLAPDIRNRYNTSSLQFISHAAAPCPIEVKRAMIDWWGPVIWEYYGCTELGRAATYCSPQDWLSHPGTVGKPLPGVRIEILDEAGRDLPTLEVGEVFVHMENMTEFTYFNAPEKRQAVSCRECVTCGDVGYLDAEGFLYLSDRRNDMVISGGVNIYPAQIEATLLGLGGVRDCAVFGIPDEEFGEAIAAFVQPELGVVLTAEIVRSWVREKLPGYCVPRLVEFVNELPREDSGKLKKHSLREPFWEGLDRRI